MRIRKKAEGIHEGDLTPMIDMTFQLIAFFMVLVNFTQTEQNQRIQLPQSELAKPPGTRLFIAPHGAFLVPTKRFRQAIIILRNKTS